ncbi:MAG: General secretion pathway protein N [Alphaproteobacteria bacterium ADurb.BinA280]|jgi:general secretion pathway protein N|nr:hypothetical protein [Xanthomonadales bacterium]OPZ10767.1 MAG: General secretion pathway protein N [Alphaproteobacteria bacterium ADurb.BinA280]
MNLRSSHWWVTAALAASAAWSLLFALAAFAGLGGRYQPLAADASLAPPVPTLDLQRATSRLDSVSAYAEIAERPLFNPDRRPVPPPDSAQANAPVAENTANFEVILTSVLLREDLGIAVVLHSPSGNSHSVKLGEELKGDLAGWKLVELAPRKAVFEGPGGRKEAALRVFDGTGGQAPTAVETPVAPNAPNQAAADSMAQPAQPGAPAAVGTPAADTPEARAELIRKRIEERRRQMREEAERNRGNQ